MPNKYVVALLLCIAGHLAVASPITVSIGTAPLPILEDFESFTGGTPGSLVDVNSGALPGVTAISGGQISARFIGQSVSGEMLGTTLPTPLMLAFNVPNIGVFDFDSTTPDTGLAGNKAYGGEVDSDGGGLEGVPFSILFNIPQNIFGLEITSVSPGPSPGNPGAPVPGSGYFDFYAVDGALIQTVTVASLMDGDYTFVGGWFSALTIRNSDQFGITLDDFRFLPLTDSMSLMLLGVALMGIRNRRPKNAG